MPRRLRYGLIGERRPTMPDVVVVIGAGSIDKRLLDALAPASTPC